MKSYGTSVIDNEGHFLRDLTRPQRISLIIIQLLQDKELTITFLRILEEIELKDAQKFHCSLRRNITQNWDTINDLCKRKMFHHMDPTVPITFDLPLTGREWRLYKELTKKINYLFPGFIFIRSGQTEEEDLLKYSVGVRGGADIQENTYNHINIKKYIEAIEHIYGKSPVNTASMGNDGTLSIYKDFRDSVDNYYSDLEPWQQSRRSDGSEPTFLFPHPDDLGYMFPYIQYNEILKTSYMMDGGNYWG